MRDFTNSSTTIDRNNLTLEGFYAFIERLGVDVPLVNRDKCLEFNPVNRRSCVRCEPGYIPNVYPTNQGAANVKICVSQAEQDAAGDKLGCIGDCSFCKVGFTRVYWGFSDPVTDAELEMLGDELEMEELEAPMLPELLREIQTPILRQLLLEPVQRTKLHRRSKTKKKIRIRTLRMMTLLQHLRKK